MEHSLSFVSIIYDDKFVYSICERLIVNNIVLNILCTSEVLLD